MRAFSLIETVVALAIIGLILLFGLSLAARESATRSRLEAHRTALSSLESVLEGIRAGGGRPADCSSIPAAAGRPEPGEIRLCSELTPEVPTGLYRLRLHAEVGVGSRPVEHEVETLLWRP